MRPKKLKPLMPRKLFLKRMMLYFFFTFLLIAFSLAIGMIGYHHYGNIGWIDSLYNASMILTGMGPVDHLQSNEAKIFASAYAIYSGVAFLSSVAVLIGPVAHRFLHMYHMDMEED